MELHQTFKLNNHGLIIKSNTPPSVSKSKKHAKKKRVLEGSLGHSLQHFPLLVWSGQPNEEDDHNNGKKHTTKYTTNTKKKEGNHMVGWPPIKSWRKKELYDQKHPTGGMMMRNDMMQAHDQSRGSNSFYVKVEMEGVAIGRRIDLRLFNSYQTLKNTLISMFAKYHKVEVEGASYTLRFQNEQGDWLLVGNVPWQSFIGTVQRVEILRKGQETT